MPSIADEVISLKLGSEELNQLRVKALAGENDSLTKYVYFFGQGSAEGTKDQRTLLGGKGANLAEMTSLGIPVPPGFTISTEICQVFYDNKKSLPDWVKDKAKRRAKIREAMALPSIDIQHINPKRTYVVEEP